MLIFFYTSVIHSQEVILPDSTAKVHNPKLASSMSAILPGLGQAYNKKYWKIPIIYAGIGTMGYLAVNYRKDYIIFRDAYKDLTDDDPNTIDYFNGQISADELSYWRDKYRRTMELNIIGIFVVYMLNIVDASVDAHFFNYDISEDLTLKIEPVIMNSAINNQNAFGIKYKIRF